jgi:hypothetical protein
MDGIRSACLQAQRENGYPLLINTPRSNPTSQPNLPNPVPASVKAANSFDLDAIMATFNHEAMVNDHRCEFPSAAAIRG